MVLGVGVVLVLVLVAVAVDGVPVVVIVLVVVVCRFGTEGMDVTLEYRSCCCDTDTIGERYVGDDAVVVRRWWEGLLLFIVVLLLRLVIPYSHTITPTLFAVVFCCCDSNTNTY